LGVEVVDVEVVTGDSDQFHWGTGTFASRGAVVAGNAVHAAAKEVRAKALQHAAKHLGVGEDEVELTGGAARVKGDVGADLRGDRVREIGLGELARLSNPMRGAVEPGTEPGLESTSYFGPQRGATASGAHACIVEVDRETFDVRVLKYVVV